MQKVNITIDGISLEVDAGITILEAARLAKIEIPTLCYLKDINEIGACRMCVCEVEGARSLVASCVYPVADGMVIRTNTQKVHKARKTNLELILSNHRQDCLSCSRHGKCELQKLSFEYSCNARKFDGELYDGGEVDLSPWLKRDNSRCINCRRCVSMCQKQQVAVIGANERGFDTKIGCAFDGRLEDSACIACGQCINVCPTGALRENSESKAVVKALMDEKKHVVVGVAPAVRVTLGEEFGFPYGTNVEGKLVTALKRIGFDAVFDVDVAADVTIMEEGTELLGRLNDKFSHVPLITSCSPGWIRYVERYYPELLPHVSSCKSPQQMFGALVKTYYAEKNNLKPEDIFVVTIMPCVAKKFEKTRPYQDAAGVPDIDASLTVRELARLIKRRGLNFAELDEQQWDAPLGISTGAGAIFGATGGVMEAALRTVAEILENKPLENVDFEAVRGLDGIKEATVVLGGKEINVAAAHGIANAKVLLEQIKNGTSKYHFIEIMACPGGCVAGGGQPLHSGFEQSFTNIKALRAKGLYDTDKNMPLRKSHESPVVKVLYDEYLEKPGSTKAHKLLHTKYEKQEKY